MIFSKKKKVLSAVLSLAMIGSMAVGVPFSASADTTTTTTTPASVSYSIYENKGWKSATDGAPVGNANKGYKAEALKVSVSGLPTGASISYSAYENKAWHSATDGAPVGNANKNLAIEALKVSLNNAPDYSISYSIYENKGWSTAKDGAPVGSANKGYKVEAVKISVTKKVPTTTAVKTLTATSAKALAVTFSAPVADTTKATFTLKRGSSSTITVSGFTTAWNADKTVATLSQDTNYAADTYKVTAAGIDNLDATANSASVEVKAQTVTKIEITSKSLIKSKADAAGTSTSGTFTYKVTDQYGNDMTASVSNGDINASVVTGNPPYSVSVTPSKGLGTITHDFTAVEGAKTAVISLVHGATGVNATATLDVVAAASVNSLTFGDNVTYPSGKTRIETNQAAAVTVPVTALDQYGNKITDYNQLNQSLNIVASNGSIQAFNQDADGNPVFVLDTKTTAITDKTTLVVTFVNITTGTPWSKNFDIVKPAEAYKLVVNDFSKATIANGDSGVALPIDVYDQFGTQLSKADIATAANAKIINDSIGGATGLGGLTVDTDANSSTYGQLKTGTITAASGITNAPLVLVFNAPGGVVTKNITVVPARKITSVYKIDTVNLIQGASADMKFVFKDQYDEVIKNDDILLNSFANTDYTYEVKCEKVTGDDNAVNVTTPTTTQVGAGKVTVTSDPTKTGTYKITINLNKGASTYSSASTNVIVVTNNVSGLTYGVDDIATLNGSNAAVVGISNTHAAVAANPYAQKISVTAKDASGSSYSINPADIISVTGDSNVNIDHVGGDWYVAGVDLIAKAAGSTPAVTPADATSTITVNVNTLDGIKTFSKTVKVSKDGPSYSKINVIDTALTAPIKASDSSVANWNNHLTISDTGTDFVNGVAINAVALDQYNVWSPVITAPVVVNSTDKAGVNQFGIVGGKLTLTGTILTASLNSDIKATIMYNGVSVPIIIRVTVAVVAPTVITLKDFTVTAPVTGATPQATIVSTAQYDATISWSGTPTTFAAGTAYTATIVVTPKAGYTLTGVAANSFTVNTTAATNVANSGTVTFAFPATV